MIIGLNGDINSGKTTISDFLEKEFGFVSYSIAGPLKKIGEIFRFTERQLYGSREDKLVPHSRWGVSGRVFLQKFGTEVCRDFLPKAIPEMKIEKTIWVDLTDDFILENKDMNIVISDIRFPDEVELLYKHGGKLVKVIRPNMESDSVIANHPSEKTLQHIIPDFFINNDEDLDHLYKKVSDLIRSLN